MSVCLVTPAKNEEKYIDEWICYNLQIGFDHIYIYDNNEDPATLHKVLCNKSYMEHVTINHLPIDTPQFVAYNHWKQHYSHRHMAVAFFDVDEFLVLHEHPNVKSWVEEFLYPNGGCLCVSWVFFGDNGQLGYTSDPVTQRFTKRARVPDIHVKSVVLCDDLESMQHPHCPFLKEGKNQHNCTGQVIPSGPYIEDVFTRRVDVCQLNHYSCKTWGEWMLKREKGRADAGAKWIRPVSLFHDQNFNEVYDDAAWRILQKSPYFNPTPAPHKPK